MTQDLILDTNLQSAKNLAWALYIAHALCLVFSLGTLSIFPLFVNYIKRGEAAGTFVYSHHQWQIRSFWWYAFWCVIGGVCFASLILIPLAYLIWAVVWLWKAYRLMKGFLDLSSNKPMPA